MEQNNEKKLAFRKQIKQLGKERDRIVEEWRGLVGQQTVTLRELADAAEALDRRYRRITDVYTKHLREILRDVAKSGNICL